MGDRTNPQSTEFWQGYRDAQAEILMLGLESFEGKYRAEFEDMTDSVHFRGMVKAYRECKRRLSAMLGRCSND